MSPLDAIADRRPNSTRESLGSHDASSSSGSDQRTHALTDVSPRTLQCFVVLGEELHFGRAADRLYMAQPALSRSIQRLERVLGRQLFVRTTRTVEITPFGTMLLPLAWGVLESLGALTGALTAARPSLRVAHVPGSDTMAVILDTLARGEPGLQVQEEAMQGTEQLAAVLDGRLDAAICATPGPLDPRLSRRVVRLDPLLVTLIGQAGVSSDPIDPRRRAVAAAQRAEPAADPLGRLVAAYERETGRTFRRIAVAEGSGTEAYTFRRAGARAFVTLQSQAVRINAAVRTVGLVPLQPYLEWSLVWPRERRTAALESLLAASQDAGTARRWRMSNVLPGEPWLPADRSSVD